ncbi:uncharacterized protein [Rutidosis leptorrhynchoides]|uniref:uncharacterized protein n=1 Tax=Rutidosis leptorrhynchoides TaxID=125765 RepID=UPI003A997597
MGGIFFLPQPLNLFDHEQAIQLQAFLSSFRLVDNSPDFFLWNAEQNNLFTVADAISILVLSSDFEVPIWPKVIWNNKVPSKIMLFHWLAIRKSILVRDVLSRRHILPPNSSTLCVWCLDNIESIDHLLLHCRWSFNVWTDLFRWWNLRWVIPRSIEDFSFDWYYGMGIKASKFWKLIGPATIWVIWVARNDVIFDNKYSCRSVIVRNIKLKVFFMGNEPKFLSRVTFVCMGSKPVFAMFLGFQGIVCSFKFKTEQVSVFVFCFDPSLF